MKTGNLYSKKCHFTEVIDVQVKYVYSAQELTSSKWDEMAKMEFFVCKK